MTNGPRCPECDERGTLTVDVITHQETGERAIMLYCSACGFLLEHTLEIPQAGASTTVQSMQEGSQPGAGQSSQPQQTPRQPQTQPGGNQRQAPPGVNPDQMQPSPMMQMPGNTQPLSTADIDKAQFKCPHCDENLAISPGAVQRIPRFKCPHCDEMIETSELDIEAANQAFQQLQQSQQTQ